jgi:hypothetical protein
VFTKRPLLGIGGPFNVGSFLANFSTSGQMKDMGIRLVDNGTLR